MIIIDAEKDKKVIDMRENQNFTWDKIGKVYGMSRQGAQDYYNRAKKRQVAEREHWSIKLRRMVVEVCKVARNLFRG
jgi:hypothetical protein